MNLYYHGGDLEHAARLRDPRLQWLIELGAVDLVQVSDGADGFLFAYEHGPEHYESLVARHPKLKDRPEDRRVMIALDDLLAVLRQHDVRVPTPHTWVIGIDDPLPADLTFPVFVRTTKSSWKRGGKQGKANTPRQLVDEMELLRRAFGWNIPILARQWIDIARAGSYMYGDAPQEIRVWVVDGLPVGWTFHYLHAVPRPKGFPPAVSDLEQLRRFAKEIAASFRSRLMAIDFVRDRDGKWWFLEAGPGSAAGTVHESVFKHVALRLLGRGDNASSIENKDVGGLFDVA